MAYHTTVSPLHAFPIRFSSGQFSLGPNPEILKPLMCTSLSSCERTSLKQVSKKKRKKERQPAPTRCGEAMIPFGHNTGTDRGRGGSIDPNLLLELASAQASVSNRLESDLRLRQAILASRATQQSIAPAHIGDGLSRVNTAAAFGQARTTLPSAAMPHSGIKPQAAGLELLRAISLTTPTRPASLFPAPQDMSMMNMIMGRSDILRGNVLPSPARLNDIAANALRVASLHPTEGMMNVQRHGPLSQRLNAVEALRVASLRAGSTGHGTVGSSLADRLDTNAANTLGIAAIPQDERITSRADVTASLIPGRDVRSTREGGRVYIDDIGELDVLCGRGGKSNHHSGNKKYRQVISEMKMMYRQTEAKALKTDLSRAIVDHVCSYGGRFVRKDERAGRYYLLSKSEARKKTSQALRETKELKWTA